MILTFIISVFIVSANENNLPKKEQSQFPIFNKEMILVEETRVPRPQIINLLKKKR